MRRRVSRSQSVLAFLAIAILAITATQSFAETFTTLHSFDGTDGENPRGSLTLSADGSTLYGMTNEGGGTPGIHDGTIFSIPATGGAATVLTSFNGTNGANPEGSLTLIGSTLYGMAPLGGTNDSGTIFSIPATGGVPTVLTSFNRMDGANPEGNLTPSADGSTFYGTTPGGGVTGAPGTIFSIPVTGGTPTVLASFSTPAGGSPVSSLTLSGSTLYGTDSQAHGTVISIPVTGGAPTTLGAFNSADGSIPRGGLTLVGSTFYGLAPAGGAFGEPNGLGTIFSVPVTGGTPTALLSFNGANGQAPFGGLTLSGSTFYGMTQEGGAYGYGTVFSFPVTGGPLTTLFNFNGTDGAYPNDSLTLSGSTLYGMTEDGGANGDGTIFALNLAPEPSSIVLFGFGGMGLALLAARRKMRVRSA